MQTSVRDVLDSLVAGRITLDEAAADFRVRHWLPRPRSTVAQTWGVADDGDNLLDGWGALDSDSRLTPQQYQVLAKVAARVE